MRRIFLMAVVLLVFGVFWWLTQPEPLTTETPGETLPWEHFFDRYLKPQLPVATSFALSLFPPDGEGAYVKRSFGERQNLGEDWAPEPSRQNADITVSATADGVVILADDFGAVWGKVVILLHRLPDGDRWPAVESMYANLATISVQKGQTVAKGESLGLIGKSKDTPAPELHFEIRTVLGHMLGPGEADLADGWVNPSKFIEERKR